MIGRSEMNDAESFERAWTSRSTRDIRARRAPQDDVDALLRTAELLTRSAAIQPTEQFTSDLRARLMTEAADVLVAVPATSGTDRRVAGNVAPAQSPRRRRLAGLAAAIVASTATVGLVSSSASAVPGDVLYPVKRGVESVQLAVHRDDAGRGQTQLDQASERLLEAWTLDSTGHDDRVAEALDAFSEQATDGSTALFEAYDSEGDAGRVDAVTTFATGSSDTLVNMSENLPADAQAALESATETVLGLAERAGTLCTSCAEADLGALAEADDAVDGGPASPREESGADSSVDRSSTGEAQAPASGRTQQPEEPAAPRPTTAPSPSPKPAPSPTPSTPGLPPIIDPVVGGLLGNDQQPGLVPSLLDGLLGN
ncbi:DUF5667 domain-containing protein [Aeromicrobium sp. CF3.5]|uniref:DUF5667 domain-containing protein n=1 Tax=Aeromicrobium sp. CF3.5 TaxID=3373078 RepID=UPI003EE4A035